jgi:16S rRNA (guanine(966)-N(2))-methyltransferase RsmD
MRVIAGRLRGLVIRVPKAGSVRPTYDRVRESMFSILDPLLADAAVLDLFAGSGSLGIESLSRGASAATFVEKDASVLSVARGNVERLGVGAQSRFVHGDALALLGSGLPGGPFDVIFVDPPYSSGLAERSLELLGRSGAPSGSAVVVVEHDRSDELPVETGRLVRFRTRRYGSTAVDFYEARQPAAGGGEDT